MQCFIAAIVQCLFGIAPLRDALLSGAYRNHLRPDLLSGQFVDSFSTLVQSMSSRRRRRGGARSSGVALGGFLPSIVERNPDFSNRELQHDAHELYETIIEGVSLELNRSAMLDVSTSLKADQVPEQQVGETEEAFLRRFIFSRRVVGSVVKDLFEVSTYVQTASSCERCQRTSGRVDSQLSLSVAIPIGRSKATLQGCLASYFSDEAVEFNCHCMAAMDGDMKRMGTNKATRKTDLATLPPVLVIQLKRSMTAMVSGSVVSQKINTVVDFPVRGLDLAAHLADGVEAATYDLFGTTDHIGPSLAAGHYKANVLLQNGRWHECNDETVTAISEAELVSEHNCILFYRRRDLFGAPPAVAAASTHAKLKAILAAKFPSNDAADKELRWLRREIRSADDETAAEYREQLLALEEIVRDRSESKSAGGVDDEEEDSDDEHVEGSAGCGRKPSGRKSSGGTSSKKSSRAPKGPTAGNSGPKRNTYSKNRKLNSKGNPLRNDNAGSCGGDHVHNVNKNHTAAAKAVPVLTKVEDQRKAMDDNLAVCSGIEKRTAELIDNATNDVVYHQRPQDVGRGQAQQRGSACFTPHGDNLGGTRSTDHSAKAKKSIEVFLNALKQFLIRNGMDPRDEGLVEGYSILFQRGGGMGWHPDTAKKDFQRCHWLRLVFSLGGSGALDFASRSFETGDGQATKIDPNHPLPISVTTTEGYHLYGMSARMSGMSALCWTNEEKSRAIQQYHRVNQIPLDGNQRANIVITAPFRRCEDVEKVLAAIDSKLFSLFPAGSQREATARAKRAAVDAVNSKDVIRCESDETYDCQHCSSGQAITAIRPENGGGDRFSCPPTHCGKCVAELVESGDFELDAFIPADRYPMDCQCGRDKMGNAKCCSIHFGENKPCLGCKKLGCYRNRNWCEDCVRKSRPGKDKECLDCGKKGCYQFNLLCRGCLGIGTCSKCGGDKEAGNHKYCDTCEPLCKEKKCNNMRRSHLKTRNDNQYCALHSRNNRVKKSGRKPCAKCGKDKGEERKWCPTCRDICKNCGTVLTTDRKNKTAGAQHYCSNMCHVASKKKAM